MKKLTVALGLLIIVSAGVIAQTSKSAKVSGSGSSSTSANSNGSTIQSGTQITGQLQNSLDAKNARVGDQVILKMTNAVKQDGHVVVPSGSRLIGHVTEVQQRAKNSAGSKIGVLFDTLQQGAKSIPISAVVTSITQARAAAAAPVGGDDMMTSGSTSSTTQTRSSGGGGGGGLLGGVTNTVGGLVNTTTQTVGGVTNTVGQTAGSTTQAVGGTLSGLQISQSAGASASGSSTLSLSSGNLRIEKGATFNLAVSQASNVSSN